MGHLLDQSDKCDLIFSLGTSYALQGGDNELALKHFKAALEEAPAPARPFILNNMGITFFFEFFEKSREITDPQGAGLDAIKPLIANFEDSLFYLKSSIREFEQFEALLTEMKQTTEVSVEQVAKKLFIDQFLALEPRGEFATQKISSYDLKENAKNEAFLKSMFKQPPVILPLQNLGEVALIMHKFRDAFAFLDMSLKLFKSLDPQNLLQFKTMTLLGSLLES